MGFTEGAKKGSARMIGWFMKNKILGSGVIIIALLVAALSIQTLRVGSLKTLNTKYEEALESYVIALDELKLNTAQREAALIEDFERERRDHADMLEGIENIKKHPNDDTPASISGTIDFLRAKSQEYQGSKN